LNALNQKQFISVHGIVHRQRASSECLFTVKSVTLAGGERNHYFMAPNSVVSARALFKHKILSAGVDTSRAGYDTEQSLAHQIFSAAVTQSTRQIIAAAAALARSLIK
jgi:hypothetical protein